MANNKDVSILIIDDEEPIRRLLALYLSDEYTCVTAASADEAPRPHRPGAWRACMIAIR